MACFVGASNVEERLGDFTDEIELAETDYVKEQCALLAQAKAYELFALGMDSWCLSAADMKNKYYVKGTNGANCKEGFGKGDSMFVYSLGKYLFTFITSKNFLSPKTFIEIQKTKQNNKTPAYENLKAKIWKLDPMDCIKTRLAWKNKKDLKYIYILISTLPFTFIHVW